MRTPVAFDRLLHARAAQRARHGQQCELLHCLQFADQPDVLIRAATD